MGVAFLVAVALLLAAGVATAARPADGRVAIATASLFAGLIAAYTLSRTTGIPLLSPEREPVDAVGVATNLVEALGFGFASLLVQRRPPHRERRLILKEVSR